MPLDTLSVVDTQSGPVVVMGQILVEIDLALVVAVCTELEEVQPWKFVQNQPISKCVSVFGVTRNKHVNTKLYTPASR